MMGLTLTSYFLHDILLDNNSWISQDFNLHNNKCSRNICEFEALGEFCFCYVFTCIGRVLLLERHFANLFLNIKVVS